MSASRAAAVLVAVGAMVGVPSWGRAADLDTDARVRAAIEAAVGSRIGRSLEVEIDALEYVITNEASGTLIATPDPAGRTGQALRFGLAVSGARPGGAGVHVGRATAVIAVSADHVRARRAVTRGAVIQHDDVEVVHERLPDLPLRPVPALAEVVGGRAARDWTAGLVVTADAVIATPAVRSGDRVRVLARVSGVEAETSGVAVESGMAGRVIRIMNPETRRTLRARVVGSGEVEVINER